MLTKGKLIDSDIDCRLLSLKLTYSINVGTTFTDRAPKSTGGRSLVSSVTGKISSLASTVQVISTSTSSGDLSKITSSPLWPWVYPPCGEQSHFRFTVGFSIQSFENPTNTF